jgi:hypothetical protein
MKLNKNHLEELIAKSFERYARLEDMEAPEEIIQMEFTHLNKLLKAKANEEKIMNLLGGNHGRNHC